jgi:thioredoxin reductase (NADPH)
VADIDFKSKPLKIKTGSGLYETNSIIIATGASAKMLGIASETKFLGKGVSTCATCDGPFFRNKTVLVVGGGDTAMEDSLFLTKFAKSITLIHRRDEFRASKIMQEKVLSNEKIKVLWSTGIDEILGGDRVASVRLKNLKDGKITELKVDGVFMAIGHQPNTAFLKGKLKLDDNGYIITKDEVKTDVAGVFVAGDVADHVYRQAVTAAASGTKAALEARSYLQNLK